MNEQFKNLWRCVRAWTMWPSCQKRSGKSSVSVIALFTVIMPMLAIAGTLGEGLNCPTVEWVTGGTPSVVGESVNWSYTTDDSYSDGACVVSGAGGAGVATSWLKTTVVGPCKIAFRYRFQTYGGDFTVTDNSSSLISRLNQYTSRNESWTSAEFELDSGSHEIKFQYRHPGQGFVGAYNGVHLDEFVVEHDITLAAALDAPDLVFTTGGNANWFAQAEITHYGEDAAQSGAISANQSSGMQTTITGSASVAFWWKVSSEQNYDLLHFYVDGMEKMAISGITDWSRQSVIVTGAGTHTLKWEYSKDGSVSNGEDCGWVDQVTITGTPSGEARTYYVDGTMGSDSNTGLSASAAKRSIQAAIDVAADGSTILVAAGTYAPIITGNRGLTIIGSEGKDVTFVDGNGTSRCAYLGESTNECATVMRGFTLTNGYVYVSWYGDGGAGVKGGTLNDCRIVECRISGGWGGFGGDGGGANGAFLENCEIRACSALAGGGCGFSIARNCDIRNCHAEDDGGGAYSSRLENCLIVDNYGYNIGGYGCGYGVSSSEAYNCTIAYNCGRSGGGIIASELYNCIAYGNEPQNIYPEGERCPETTLVNCMTENPGFVDVANGDYRLAVGSPCINAGDNSYVMGETDLAGNVRVEESTVDIGCYEFSGEVERGLYMVIDLSGGESACRYPVSYLEAAPINGWSDEFKTSKLVLRRIEGCGELPPYYIGVFEFTQRQWELLLGTRPSYNRKESCYMTRPVEQVSYEMVRGSLDAVSAGSLLGILRSKTGLNIDLPTCLQFQYASWSGNGRDVTLGRGKYAQTISWDEPARDLDTDDIFATATVGTYQPNEWGVYDMLGNVQEFVRDEIDGVCYSVGGSWNRFESLCTSVLSPVYESIDMHALDWTGIADGFRIVCEPSAAESMIIRTVIFDAQGGNCERATTDVVNGAAIGRLPMVTRAGYTFDGWYTADGRLVTPGIVVTTDLTLYAHWTRTVPEIGFDDADEPIDVGVANTYNGVIVDVDGLPLGYITVKMAKVSGRGAIQTCKVTASIQMSGENKKVTIKAAVNALDATLMATASDGRVLDLLFSRDSICGTFDGYAVEGVRNLLASSAKSEEGAAVKAKAEGVFNRIRGNYALAFGDDLGYNGLSVSVMTKGKVKVSGKLANGTTVATTSQLIVGEDYSCIPVIYTKKGASLAFSIYFSNDMKGDMSVVGCDDAVIAPIGGLESGSLFSVGEWVYDLFNEYELLDGFLPWAVSVEPNKAKWIVAGGAKAGKIKIVDGEVVDTIETENPAGLKLTYNSKTGMFKGSFKIYALNSNGKLKTFLANVSGIVVDGVGYGSATIKGMGTVAVYIYV